jgi:hypothetical protein
MPFRRPNKHEACGATNRNGEPCKNWPARTSRSRKRRCRFHGGVSLQGMAHPGYQHGLRSRALCDLAVYLHRGAQIERLDYIAMHELYKLKRRELYALLRAIADARWEALPDDGVRPSFLCLGKMTCPKWGGSTGTC